MSSQDYQTLIVEQANKVATVTLNRPERLNAVDPTMHNELEEFFGAINGDEDVNAIVLTGAGRAFCAGGDMRGAANTDPEENYRGAPVTFGRGPRRLILNMLEIEVPVIAAVNGDAIGLGATLALLCDVIIASETARIADTHVKMGLVAGDGGALVWPLLVGVHRAKEYLMTGDFVPAPEAERIGLINHVVPPDETLPKAQEMAERLANGPTWAIRWTKASVNKTLRDRFNLILDTSLAYEAITSRTEDHREAATSFFEKRPPSFKGR
jgi:enoyl-CoA hydratase